MNNILIVDNKNEIFSRVCLNEQSFIGYSYSKTGIYKSNSNYIINFLKSLLYSDKCIYIKDENDYKVYLDEENNLYHYLKDGKEDINLFVEKNSTDAISYINKFYYNEKLPQNHADNDSRLLSIKEGIIISTKTLLISLINAALILNTSFTIQNHLITDDIPFLYENAEKISKEDAIYMISSSEYVTDSQKEVLLNDDLLDNVIPYYQDSNMSYVIRDHLQDIEIVYYDEKQNSDADGYYNQTKENVIHLKEGLNEEYTDKVISHEFIHLLQNPSCQLYKNICEASAELIASEYYDRAPVTYIPAINNLKLLLDIVGPEVI